MSQFESQFEEDLYRARLETLEKIAALGQQAYPNSFAFTHTVPALLPLGLDADGKPKSAEALEAEHFTAAVAGRIVAIRLQGKAGFATLLQGGKRLQIYVRKDDVGETGFALYKLLDLGDHIGVRGTLMRTRTGELTLKAAALSDGAAAGPALTFLTKALLPLPDKYSGLGDIELRYRRRYLDLFTDTGESSEPSEGADTAAGAPAVASESSDEGHVSPSKWHGFSPAISDPAVPEASAPEAVPEASAPEAQATLHAAEAVTKGHGFSRAITGEPQEGASAPEAQAASVQTRLPSREVFTKRAAILRAIRNFFDTRGYLEVETPMLHTVAGGAAARPFTTHHNALDIPLSLRIAPELYLKRLVVGGFDRVYEINRNFRNEGVSTQHNPEFTMLEFYQAYANYHDLMDLTQELITTVAQEVNGTTITNFNGVDIDLNEWTKLSMREAIIKFWPPEAGKPMTMSAFRNEDIFFFAMSDAIGAIQKIDIGALQNSEQVRITAMFAAFDRAATASAREPGYDDRRPPSLVCPGKAISELFEFLAEPHLIQPTIIYDFPLAVSPLSKVKPDEPDWVERFEFYIGGFEVGNAFSELNDPADQLRRFETQVADKDPESMAAVDEDYVRALGYGLPPTAGEGIGIDRLTMILTGSRSIRDVILFPLMRPQKPIPDQEVEQPHGDSAE